MSKTISFEYDGTPFTLEFTRATVEEMERRGFVIENIVKKPALTIPVLFNGAFLAHHKFVKKKTIDEIYEAMPNKDELLSKLAEMYNDAVDTLMDEPDSAKKVNWETSW